MVPALPDALRGHYTPESVFLGDLERDRVMGFSSENLPQLAAALALLNAHYEDDAYDRQFWIEWWRARLAWERENFMGVELTSRTYGSWHYMAKRAVYEAARRDGITDLAADCYSWMMAFLAFAAVASGKRPGRYIVDHRIAEPGVIYGTGDEVKWAGRYVAWSGDRADSRQSGGGEWWGWLSISSAAIWLSLALGEPVGECDERDVEQACGVPAILPADAAILRGIRDGNYAAALPYLAEWSPQVPTRVVQTTEGVWTLSPIGRGSSTPHAYAVAQWHDTGNVAGLYADPGWRDAGPQDWIVSGSARVDGNVAVAVRSDGKYGSPHHLVLPGGKVLFDMTWGPDGANAGSAPVQPHKPTEPTTPPPVVVDGDPWPPPEIQSLDGGRWLVLWRGNAEVLGWPADDGRTMVVLSQEV